MKRNLIAIFITALVANFAYAEPVCSNHDGDTFKLCNGQSIRLYGVDAPELIQPMGHEARDYLRKLLVGRDVRLICVGKSYKRSVCRVEVSTPAGPIDASREMAGRGLAFDSPRYSHGEFKNAEVFAQSLGRGVWSLPGGGTRPWDFRSHQ
jgi:endonuclease YncB( thermonuclease family)